jgi:hypothetical protein
MSELERVSNWKIEAYGKCNRVYTPICIYWEDEVTFDEAGEIFFELITPTPPRNLVAHASENPDFTFYEIRLIETRTGFEAAHVSWTQGVMKELIEDYKANPYVTVRAEVDIDMPAELAEQTDPWDWEEIMYTCTIRFVDKDS